MRSNRSGEEGSNTVQVVFNTFKKRTRCLTNITFFTTPTNNQINNVKRMTGKLMQNKKGIRVKVIHNCTGMKSKSTSLTITGKKSRCPFGRCNISPTHHISDSIANGTPGIALFSPAALNNRLSLTKIFIGRTEGQKAINLTKQNGTKNMRWMKGGRGQNDMGISWLKANPIQNTIPRLIQSEIKKTYRKFVMFEINLNRRENTVYKLMKRK